MKKFVLISTLILAFVSVGVAQDPGWPRLKTNSGGKLIYYQPQVDEWSGYKDLVFRMAFSLTPAGGKQVVGVVNVHSGTDVNVDARTVLLSNPVIADTNFPSLDPTKAAEMDKLLRTFLPSDFSTVISLDRLVASVNKSQPAATVAVRNDPPAIFLSNRPAMLVQVDGPPVMADIKETKLQFVVNTNWPIFFDKQYSNYYLFTGKQWLFGGGLNGPWLATAKLPADMTKVAKDKQWAGLASAITPTLMTSGMAPTVFYSTGPAEVILFQGKPVYANIPGTQLLYASNTEADLFVHKSTQQYFYLAAGRWFTGPSLQGPWTYASENLPADFSQIPESSPAARVLVSVPGTEQAKDSVLLAQVPTTVEIDPAAAATKVNVAYSGPPEFKAIEGTSLSYAVNTSDKVIKFGDDYYLCFQGVWFLSTNAQGPWHTATSIPKEIYTIPPSSPVYNVTYVTQTVTPTGTVHASYTAGYMGSFVVRVGFGWYVACGTGYYYPPYFYYPAFGYPIYHYYPVTYGYGAFYGGYAGAYGVARGVYGPYRGATGWAAYNPYTGTYARGGSVYGPYGSASFGRAYNPYTGVGAATRQASGPYGQWGSSVVRNGNQTVRTGHISTSQGTIVGARSSTGAAVVAGRGARGSGGVARTAGGDLYAAKDGNLYKKTDSGWQSHNNGSWNSVNHTAAQPAQMQSMKQEMQNRQRGATSSQNFQNFQRSGGYSGGRSYGGYRGGGGFRGGRRR